MTENQTPELRKTLGLFELTVTGIGIILGAGIYVIIGKAAGMSGGAIWIPFLLSALAAALTGLSYAELSSMFPSASASFEFTRRAFGLRMAFLVGWLLLFANVVSAAAVALGFGGYLSSLLDFAVVPAAIALIGVCCVVLILGVKETVRIGVLFTFMEVGGLLIAIFVSARFWGSVDYMEMPEGFSGIFTATTLIFFAYLGFEQVASLSEEAKRPHRSIPLAVVIAIAVTTVLYLAVAVSSVSAVDWRILGESDAPLSDVVEVGGGARLAEFVGVIALFATANTVLFLMLTSSRMMYGMASSGTLPRQLSRVHSRRQTPWVATIVAAVIGVGFALIGDIESVAQLTNFAVLAAFAVVNASLIWMRISKNDLNPQFRLPLNVWKVPVTAVFGFGVSLFMIASIRPGLLLAGVLVAAIGVVLPLILWRGSRRPVDSETTDAIAS